MRVLIVDDEVLIKKCLARVALSRGHTVQTESNGLKGLKAWREFKPHLVFLDVLLPGLDGPSVLQQAGKKNNEKVVMMSAHKAFSDCASIPGVHLPGVHLPGVHLPRVDLFVSKPFPDIVCFFKQAEGLFNLSVDSLAEL